MAFRRYTLPSIIYPKLSDWSGRFVARQAVSFPARGARRFFLPSSSTRALVGQRKPPLLSRFFPAHTHHSSILFSTLPCLALCPPCSLGAWLLAVLLPASSSRIFPHLHLRLRVCLVLWPLQQQPGQETSSVLSDESVLTQWSVSTQRSMLSVGDFPPVRDACSPNRQVNRIMAWNIDNVAAGERGQGWTRD